MSKKILSIAIAVLLFTPLFSQLFMLQVNANHNSAMTSPNTFFNVIGKVTYRQLGRLFNNAQRTTGVDDVVVTATGFFDRSKKYTTTTDPDGVYSFNIPAGMYRITVDDPADKANFFTPPFRFERINTHRAQNASFQGLIFP